MFDQNQDDVGTLKPGNNKRLEQFRPNNCDQILGCRLETGQYHVMAVQLPQSETTDDFVSETPEAFDGQDVLLIIYANLLGVLNIQTSCMVNRMFLTLKPPFCTHMI